MKEVNEAKLDHLHQYQMQRFNLQGQRPELTKLKKLFVKNNVKVLGQDSNGLIVDFMGTKVSARKRLIDMMDKAGFKSEDYTLGEVPTSRADTIAAGLEVSNEATPSKKVIATLNKILSDFKNIDKTVSSLKKSLSGTPLSASFEDFEESFNEAYSITERMASIAEEEGDELFD